MKQAGIPSFRPTIMGARHATASGHYLATAAAMRVLELGGNAIDAGVAGGIALNVVLPGKTSFGGVAPILIYDARQKRVASISGLGRWPRATKLEHFTKVRGGRIPVGAERVVVPAAADAWMTALIEHGTMSFEQVVAPALEYARNGIAVGHRLSEQLLDFEANQTRFPTLAEVFLKDGRAPRYGEILHQPALARTFERLIEVERGASRKGRENAIRTARDFFYKGPIAEEIAGFVQDGGGFLTVEDMAEFAVGHEPPVSGRFHQYEVYTNGPWCQGPTFAEALQIVSDDDLASIGHNTPDYIHLVAEALKLAFADRDAFIGDPDFVDVPVKGLLNRGYAAARRKQIDMTAAASAMPDRGDPWRFEGRSQPVDYAYRPPEPRDGDAEPDTSFVCAVDRWGNMFAATPSDAATIVAPGLGFTPSTRGTQSWLDPSHPSVLAPWRRPRLTPNALIAFRDGEPWMPFGTPGGDAQIQAALQFFLNVTVFGMTPQQGVETPRFMVWSFPNSFWPHTYWPGMMQLEGRFSPDVARRLEQLGHKIKWIADIAGNGNAVCAVTHDRATGVLAAAADFRLDAYALAR